MGRTLPILSQNEDFVRRIGAGWSAGPRAPRVPEGLASSAAAHRETLSQQFLGTALVVFAGEAMLRNDDNNFLFRADSDFLWLTGCPAEGAVLVMTPRSGGHDAVLYIPEPITAGSPSFLESRNHSELWVGPSPDLRGWADALGVEVRSLHSAEPGLGTSLRAVPVQAAGRLAGPLAATTSFSGALAQTISEMRLIKDAWEIGQLREAVDASVGGFNAVAAELEQSIEFGGERWLQGTFDRHARTLGNGVGYGSIVAAGSHAPVLHWTRSDGPVLPNHLVLLDAGVETNSFYSADVTRTFPAGGTFSAEQRAVHDLVQASHEAGLAAVGPGRQFTDFHFAAMEVIAQGLHDWGMLPVSVDEALTDSGQHHRRYLICGIGHHLGLDVHDCSRARHEHYHAAAMEPGMVITVEPGLYFHENDETVPPELRGIGVRIEDDIVVTETGSEVLSAALPIDATGLEQWVAQQRR